VLGAAEVAAVILVAGAFGQLRPAIVLAAETLWLAGLAPALLRPGPARTWIRGARTWAPARSPRASVRGWPPWPAVLVAFAVLALAWQALVALLLPPFAYDALTYHLTIAAAWLQQESVEPTALSLCCAYYPANAELLFTWPMLLLGTDTLVDTVQLGGAVLGALAVAGIARSAGLGDAVAAAAAALFALTPIVLTQAPTNYADLLIASLSLAALHSALRFAVTAEPRRLVPAGLAAGLLLGMKGTGIVWAVVLTAGVLTLVVVALRRRRIGRRAAAGAAAAFLAACLALGSFWFVRNWVDTGNPAYPFRVEVAGTQVFEGPVLIDEVLTPPDENRDLSTPEAIVRSWASDLDFWNQGSYDYQQRFGGLGPLWPWLGLPLLLALAVPLVRKRSPLLLALAAVAVVFALQPYRWWSRFTIDLAALGSIAIAATAIHASRAWVRRLVAGSALALALAGALLASSEVDPSARAEPLGAIDVVRLAGEPEARRSLGRLFFPEYRFLDDVPTDATIAVDLEAPEVRFVYPLFGPGLERSVVPVEDGRAPAGAWLVTAAGRPADREARASGRFTLASAVGGLHAWRPNE
jgi:hypothetical protein